MRHHTAPRLTLPYGAPENVTRLAHPRLAEVERFLDGVRADLERASADAPATALNAADPAGGWSGAQIIQHLGKVEGSTAKFLEGVFALALAAGLADEVANSSVLGVLDRFQVDGAVLRPLVAPERLRPAPDADLAESWESLRAVRERLFRAYATVDGKDLTTVHAPHPLFGPLNGYEWLVFIGKHEQRHLAQLRRLIATVRG